MIEMLYGPGVTGAVVVVGLVTVEIAKTIRAKRNGQGVGFTHVDRALLIDTAKAHGRTVDVLERMELLLVRMDERSKV
jgi:hypothetical protein